MASHVGNVSAAIDALHWPAFVFPKLKSVGSIRLLPHRASCVAHQTKMLTSGAGSASSSSASPPLRVAGISPGISSVARAEKEFLRRPRSTASSYERAHGSVARQRGPHVTSVSSSTEGMAAVPPPPRTSQAPIPTADRALRDVLFKPDSHDALYRAVRRHVDIFSARNAATALRSLVHLERGDHQGVDLLQVREGLRQEPAGMSVGARAAEAALAARIALHLDGRSDVAPAVVASIVGSLAHMGKRPPFDSLIHRLFANVISMASRGLFSGRDAATIFWATDTLKLGDLCEQVLAELVPVLLAKAENWELSPHDVSLSLWSAARFSVAGIRGMGILMLSLVKAAQGRTSRFDNQSLSLTFYALGLASSVHLKAEVKELVAELSLTVLVPVSTMSAQCIANTAWGSARLSVQSCPFYDALAQRATLLLRQGKLSDQHLCNVVWALAKAEVQSRAVAKHFLAVGEDLVSTGRLAIATPQHVAGTVWALATAVCLEAETTPGVVTAAMAAAATRATSSVDEWAPKWLALVAWAATRARVEDELLPLQQGVVRRYDAMTTQSATGTNMCLPSKYDYNMVVWSLSSAGLCADHFPAGSLHRMVMRAWSTSKITIEEQMSLVRACVKMDLRSVAVDRLLRQAVDIAAQGLIAGTWTSRHALNLAWFLVVRGEYNVEAAHFVLNAYAINIRLLARAASVGGSVGSSTRMQKSSELASGEMANVRHIQLSQLAVLDTALTCEPGLTAVAGPNLDRIPRAPVVVADVTQSSLQVNVEDSLRCIGFRDELLAEEMLRCFSVDLLILPTRKAQMLLDSLRASGRIREVLGDQPKGGRVSTRPNAHRVQH